MESVLALNKRHWEGNITSSDWDSPLAGVKRNIEWFSILQICRLRCPESSRTQRWDRSIQLCVKRCWWYCMVVTVSISILRTLKTYEVLETELYFLVRACCGPLWPHSHDRRTDRQTDRQTARAFRPRVHPAYQRLPHVSQVPTPERNHLYLCYLLR